MDDVFLLAYEQGMGLECIGFFDGVPYFIDVDAPFGKNYVYWFNPKFDMEPVDEIDDLRIREAAESAMYRRDTINQETYTKEKSRSFRAARMVAV